VVAFHQDGGQPALHDLDLEQMIGGMLHGQSDVNGAKAAFVVGVVQSGHDLPDLLITDVGAKGAGNVGEDHADRLLRQQGVAHDLITEDGVPVGGGSGFLEELRLDRALHGQGGFVGNGITVSRNHDLRQGTGENLHGDDAVGDVPGRDDDVHGRIAIALVGQFQLGGRLQDGMQADVGAGIF